jgi:hypothetical protein
MQGQKRLAAITKEQMVGAKAEVQGVVVTTVVVVTLA